MRHALVLHASRHGSTAQAAEHIATRLERHGYHLQVRPVRYQRSRVGPEHLVVLGIAVHRGRCHPEARRFLRRHRRDLAELPLALFALTAGTDTPLTPELMLAQLDRALGGLPRAAPLTTAVFPLPDPAGRPAPAGCPDLVELPDVEGTAEVDGLHRPSIDRWADALACEN